MENNKLNNNNKCGCCNGTGYVEGEHYDEKEACLTCNGRGNFKLKNNGE